MDEIRYSLRISPESLKNDLVNVTYSGDSGLNTFGVYSGMSYILSGGTGGTSTLTGLTIPIFFTQTINDLGVYSEFDGDILQKDILTNFLYSANTITPYDVYLYNTSGDINVSFLSFSTFTVDWGDGSPTETISNQPLVHNYINSPDTYTISLSGQNTWGTTVIQKEIFLPFVTPTISNLQGTVSLTPQSGNWSGMPTTYDFIFTGDSQTNIQSQISSSYVSLPIPVTGSTTSKLFNLKRYGPIPYTIGFPIFKNNQLYGQVDNITTDYTEYTINGIKYFDFIDGSTIYIAESSGFTQDNIVVSALTKNERLLDFVFDPEVQSDVYIERGKYSAFEPLQRLGEVDNIGDLVRYGYNYFKINQT